MDALDASVGSDCHVDHTERFQKETGPLLDCLRLQFELDIQYENSQQITMIILHRSGRDLCCAGSLYARSA